MKKSLIAGMLCCLLALTACTEQPKEEKPATEAPAEKKPSFTEFAALFPEGKLPMLMPVEGMKDSAFSGEAVQTFFHGKLTPAFGSADDLVPDPGECCEGVSYAPVARFEQKGQFTALVLYKQQNGSEGEPPSRYYYLGLFSPKGDYLSGMCVAYRAEGVERNATLNDDFSLQVQQIDAADMDTPGQNRFYEITPEGMIRGIAL